jgi:hypothetical protein
MMCFLILQADRENYIASILPPLVDFQINSALLVSIFATQLPHFSTLFHPSKSCRGRIQTDKQGFKSPTRSEFGTKRSQVQILSPRPLKTPKNARNKGISGVLSYLGGAGCHSEIWPVWVHFGGIGCQNGGQNRFLYCFCQAIMECRRKILTCCLAGGQTVDWGLSTV